jgi:hypothetical protein
VGLSVGLCEWGCVSGVSGTVLAVALQGGVSVLQYS